MHLLQYVLKIDTRKQVLLMLLIVVSVVLGFVNIRLEGLIIDDAIKNGIDTGECAMLYTYIFIYFLIILAAKGMSYFTEVLFMQVSQKTLVKIRTELFNHILRLNIGFFHKTPLGEIMSRIIPEVQQLGMFLSTIILIPLTSILTIISGIGLVAIIDWRLGLVSIAIYSLVFFFIPKLRKRLKGFTKDWNEKLRKISAHTEESISHYQEIQFNDTFPYEEAKFKKYLYEFWDINIDLARVHGKTTFLSQFFSGLATLSVYGLGGYLAIKTVGTAHALSVGSIFVMIRALGVLIQPINKLIDFSQGYQEALIKFEMVNDYLKIPPEMADRKNARQKDKIEGKVVAHNVSFGFDPDKKILKNVNMEIKPGEHIALVGPAGCGKSTLSLLLNRMMKTNVGEILFDETNVVDIKLNSLRKTIGYVAQAKTSTPVLFSGTLADNILYGLMRKNKNPGGELKGWLDLEGAGIINIEHLRDELLEIIKDVNFYEDVFSFGLTGVTLSEAVQQKEGIFTISDAEGLRKRILEGRSKFQEKLNVAGSDLIEFFDEAKFLTYSTLMENIIFTSAEPFMKNPDKYRQLREVLDPICEEAGILNDIFEIGCRTTIELADIFKRVKPDSTQLIRRFQIPQQAMKRLVPIGERMKNQGIAAAKDGLPPPAKDLIMRLGFEYSLAYGIDVYIDKTFEDKVMKARALFKEKLPASMKATVSFYNKDAYIDGASIRDNLIMGKINTIINRAEEIITGEMKELITQEGLDDLIISLGLLMDVGERGSRLSGGQAQKTAISRVLLKKPDVLILDEATSALDNTSQQKISHMLQKRFKNRNVITIAHRLDTIKEYDRIIVLKAGEIVETGTFDELMEKKGLFFELWNTTFGQVR